MDWSVGQQLRTLLTQDDCMIILGDLAYGDVAIPTRAQLAERLAAICDPPTDLRFLPDVAQYFALALGEQELRGNIRAAYAQRRSAADPQVLTALAQLPVSVIFTTNFDDAISQALPRGTVDRVVGMTEFAYHNRDHRLVVSVNGTLERPDSLIITKDEHFAFNENYDLLHDVLRAYVTMKTPIFIGCDLDDPYLVPFYRRISRGMGRHARRAYAIVPDATSYQIGYWRDQNLIIVQASPVTVLIEAVEALRAREMTPNSPVTNATATAATPFKFLAPFEESDANNFHGRTAEIEALGRKIGSYSFVVLHSKSGAGKTSLIRAGVIGWLTRAGHRTTYITAWTDPLSQLVDILDPAGDREREPPSRATLLRLLRWISSSGTLLTIFIDQFEQFFLSTTTTDRQRDDLIGVIEECVSGRLANVRFVIALREDFLAELHDIQRRLRCTFANYYRLRNLSPSQARTAITGPLTAAHQEVDDSLIDAILDGLRASADDIFPPQLQIVCDKLFNAAYGSGPNPRDLEEYGGVRGILSNYVSDVLRLMPGPQRAAAQAVLKALVSSHRTRTKIGVDALAARTLDGVDVPAILSLLEDQRLVSRDDEGGTTYFELTHEYVIEEISDWITDDEYDVRRAQELVDQEFYNWTQDPASYISPERLTYISQKKASLRLGTRQREFLFLNALHSSTDLDYWVDQVELADSELGDRLVADLDSADTSRRRNAATILATRLAGGAERLRSKVLSVLAEIGNPHCLDLVDRLGIDAGVCGEMIRTIAARYRSVMVHVPAGPFTMGSTEAEIDWVSQHFDIPRGWIEKEIPQHLVELDDFMIDIRLTTNSEFAEFDPTHRFPEGQELHPAVNVDWTRASKYAAWIGKRLPTEAEWEKAARGTDGRRFPWGGEYDAAYANSKESGIGTTTPVGSYPLGASPYGCLDMAGNVFEWTSSLAASYPYAADDREDPQNPGVRILRGGAFSYNYSLLRCALRYDYYAATHASTSLGFRCAAPLR